MDVASTLRNRECSDLYDQLSAKGYWMTVWLQSGGVWFLIARGSKGKIQAEGRTPHQALECAALMAEGRWTV